MLNRYPLWKYLLILIVLIGGVADRPAVAGIAGRALAGHRVDRPGPAVARRVPAGGRRSAAGKHDDQADKDNDRCGRRGGQYTR